MKYLIPLVLFVFMAGCGGGSTNQAKAPPTPLEVKVLAMASMAIVINVKELTEDDLQAMQAGLLMAKTATLRVLAEDPSSVPSSITPMLEGLDPLYQDLVGDVMQIALVRIRPYIDNENPNLKLAQEYFEASMDGALAAINRARVRLADSS